MSSSVYISGTGSDANAGTRVSPWLTISKAYSSSAAGDTIVLLSGTNTSWTSQTFTTDRTITADVSGAAILDGSSSTFVWFTNANVTLQGIVLQNANFTIGSQVNTVTLTPTNCWFKGLSVASTTALFGANGYTPTATINCTGCLFTDIADTGGFGSIFGDLGGNNATFNLFNNTIYSNHGDASTVSINRGGILNVMKNNIFWNANGSTHSFSFFVGGPTAYTGSVASSNLIRGYNVTTSLVGALTSDPLFVNASSNNFNLRPTSPCIDTGVII